MGVPCSLPHPSKWAGHPLVSGKCDYGLHSQKGTAHKLERQLKVLQEVACSPQPNLLRQGAFECNLAHGTWNRLHKDINRFMGFALNVARHTNLASLQLSLYADMPLLWDYISFLQARQVAPAELSLACMRAQQVLSYLSNIALESREATRLLQLRAKVVEMRQQLGGLKRKQVGSTVKEAEVLPDTSMFIAWQEQTCNEVLQLADAEMADDGELSFSTCIKVRDALASSLGTGGSVSLHFRASLMYTMKAPGQPDACNQPGCCAGPQCKGNRLEEMPRASLVAQTQYRVLNPHHKNSHRGLPGTSAIIPMGSLPAKLLPLYLCEARPQLLLRCESEEEPPELLLSNTGKAFDGDSWGRLWKGMLQRYGAPLPHITYHSLRHVFATDRLLNPDIPGPNDYGAAMMMNHTPEQWKASYAPNARIAAGAAAVAAGKKYRAAHLKLAQQKSTARARGWGDESE